MAIQIATGYRPGALGRIVELHGTYYQRHTGFGLFFESKVATELAEFLRRYDSEHDGLWLAVEDGSVEGSVAIDGRHAETGGAHLRWFIVSERCRGSGVGNALLTSGLDFCRERFTTHVYLWTFSGLDAARHLYEKHGFQLAQEQPGMQWGAPVNEQRFELNL